MKKKTEQSRKTYNEMAKNYDSSPEGNYTKEHRAELLRRVELKDGYNVLDVACGNGRLLEALSQKANISAHGIDISENMIKAAKEYYPNFAFKVGASVPLDFETESMDVVTVSCAFHHFEEPQRFVYECMRVLKKGGKLYMAEPFFTPVIRVLANAIFFPFSKSGDVKVYSPKKLRRFFEIAGFKNIEIYINGTVLFISGEK